MKRQLDELQPISNIKELTNKLIDNLLQIISSITIIHQTATSDSNSDRTKTIGLLGSLNETIEQLKTYQKIINEKEYNIQYVLLVLKKRENLHL